MTTYVDRVVCGARAWCGDILQLQYLYLLFRLAIGQIIPGFRNKFGCCFLIGCNEQQKRYYKIQ